MPHPLSGHGGWLSHLACQECSGHPPVDAVLSAPQITDTLKFSSQLYSVTHLPTAYLTLPAHVLVSVGIRQARVFINRLNYQWLPFNDAQSCAKFHMY